MSELHMFNNALYYQGKPHKALYYHGKQHIELHGNYEEKNGMSAYRDNWWELTPTVRFTFTYYDYDTSVCLIPYGACILVFNDGTIKNCYGNSGVTEIQTKYWYDNPKAGTDYKRYNITLPKKATECTIYGKLLAIDCIMPVAGKAAAFYKGLMHNRSKVTSPLTINNYSPLYFTYVKNLTVELLNADNFVRCKRKIQYGGWDGGSWTYSAKAVPGISLYGLFFYCQLDEFPSQFLEGIAAKTEGGVRCVTGSMHRAFKGADLTACGLPSGAFAEIDAWDWGEAFYTVKFGQMPEKLFGDIIPSGGFLLAWNMTYDYWVQGKTGTLPKRLFSDTANYELLLVSRLFAVQRILNIPETIFTGIPEKTYGEELFVSGDDVGEINLSAKLLKPVAESGADILTGMFNDTLIGFNGEVTGSTSGHVTSNLRQALADGLFSAWKWKNGINAWKMFDTAYSFPSFPKGAFAGLKARRAGCWDDVDLGLEHGGFCDLFYSSSHDVGIVNSRGVATHEDGTYKFEGLRNVYDEIMEGHESDCDMDLYGGMFVSTDKLVDETGQEFQIPHYWEKIRLHLKKENGQCYARRAELLMGYKNSSQLNEIPYLYGGLKNKGNYGNKDAAGYIKITEDEYNELNAIGGTT